MSRIHDALKKAELERGRLVPAGVPATATQSQEGSLSSFQHSSTSGRDNKTGGAVEVLPGTKRISADSDEHVLEFSEIAEGCGHPIWNPDPKRCIFVDSAVAPDGAEQFRTLRSRLYQMRNSQPLQTLLVTSSLPGEGKTFVTSNLGQSIVRQHERRALMIDGDLRRSSLHVPFRAPSSPGLSDYLRGDADLLSVIQQGPRGNLFLIPGGKVFANPSELLGNGRLKTLLGRVARAFDWILIDTPPCLPIADANIIADMCDGVLLVVKARSTPSEVVGKAGRELQGRNVLGVIMNGVDEKMLGYHSPYGTAYGPYSSNEIKPRAGEGLVEG